ncbi:uncharacterized protein LOC143298011 [Babylonia areolata]|uniref:uncharacterized protein LOC143298011 n=1 Tax=Babylonia areolata TaxID=304850 RepID=UPI003FD31048
MASKKDDKPKPTVWDEPLIAAAGHDPQEACEQAGLVPKRGPMLPLEPAHPGPSVTGLSGFNGSVDAIGASLNPDERMLQVPKDEDTMVSLDLYMETLESDAREGGVCVPPSPWHTASECSVDIMYTGLGETETPFQGQSPRLSPRQSPRRPAFVSPSNSAMVPSQPPAICSKVASWDAQPREKTQTPSVSAATHTRSVSQSAAVTQSVSKSQCAEGQGRTEVSFQGTGCRSGEGRQEAGGKGEDYQKLLDKYKRLRSNMLSLCFTAQREMQRKQHTITQLREALGQRGSKCTSEEVESLSDATVVETVSDTLFRADYSLSVPPSSSRNQSTGFGHLLQSQHPVNKQVQTDLLKRVDKPAQTDLSTTLKDKPVQTDSLRVVDKQLQTDSLLVVDDESLLTDSLRCVAVSKSTYADSMMQVEEAESLCANSVMDKPVPSEHGMHLEDELVLTDSVAEECAGNSLRKHSATISATAQLHATAAARGSSPHRSPVESHQTAVPPVTGELSSADDSSTPVTGEYPRADLSSADELSPTLTGEMSSNRMAVKDNDKTLSRTKTRLGSADSEAAVAEQARQCGKPFLPAPEDHMEQKTVVARAVNFHDHALRSTDEEDSSTETGTGSASLQDCQGARLTHSCTQPLPANRTSGRFKDVAGEGWKRKLLLWPCYAHRRVSRREGIDAVFLGQDIPQFYDWSSTSQGVNDEAEHRSPGLDQTEMSAQTQGSPCLQSEDIHPDRGTAVETLCGKSVRKKVDSQQKSIVAFAPVEGDRASLDISPTKYGDAEMKVSDKPSCSSTVLRRKKKTKKSRRQNVEEMDKKRERKKKKGEKKKEYPLVKNDHESTDVLKDKKSNPKQSENGNVQFHAKEVIEAAVEKHSKTSAKMSMHFSEDALKDRSELQSAPVLDATAAALKTAPYAQPCRNQEGEEHESKETMNGEDKDLTSSSTTNASQKDKDVVSNTVVNSSQDVFEKVSGGDSDFSIHTDDSDAELLEEEVTSKTVMPQSGLQSSLTSKHSTSGSALSSENESAIRNNEVGVSKVVTTGHVDLTADNNKDSDANVSLGVSAYDFGAPLELDALSITSSENGSVNEDQEQINRNGCSKQESSIFSDFTDEHKKQQQTLKVSVSSSAGVAASAKDNVAQDWSQTISATQHTPPDIVSDIPGIPQRTSKGIISTIAGYTQSDDCGAACRKNILPPDRTGVESGPIQGEDSREGDETEKVPGLPSKGQLSPGQQQERCGHACGADPAGSPWTGLQSDQIGNADASESRALKKSAPFGGEAIPYAMKEDSLLTRKNSSPEEGDGLSQDFSDIPTTPVGSHQLPVTPKKHWLHRTKMSAEGGKPIPAGGRIVATRDLSNLSIIWSPEKTTSNIITLREPMNRDTFCDMLGLSSNSSTSPEESTVQTISKADPLSDGVATGSQQSHSRKPQCTDTESHNMTVDMAFGPGLPFSRYAEDKHVPVKARACVPVSSNEQTADKDNIRGPSSGERQKSPEKEGGKIEKVQTQAVQPTEGSEDRSPLFGHPHRSDSGQLFSEKTEHGFDSSKEEQAQYRSQEDDIHSVSDYCSKGSDPVPVDSLYSAQCVADQQDTVPGSGEIPQNTDSPQTRGVHSAVKNVKGTNCLETSVSVLETSTLEISHQEEDEVSSMDTSHQTSSHTVPYNLTGNSASVVLTVREESLEEGEILSDEESSTRNKESPLGEALITSTQSGCSFADDASFRDKEKLTKKRERSPDKSQWSTARIKRPKTQTEKGPAVAETQPSDHSNMPKSAGEKNQSSTGHSDDKQMEQMDKQAQQRRQQNKDSVEKVRRLIVGNKHSELKSFTIPKLDRCSNSAQEQKSHGHVSENMYSSSTHSGRTKRRADRSPDPSHGSKHSRKEGETDSTQHCRNSSVVTGKRSRQSRKKEDRETHSTHHFRLTHTSHHSPYDTVGDRGDTNYSSEKDCRGARHDKGRGDTDNTHSERKYGIDARCDKVNNDRDTRLNKDRVDRDTRHIEEIDDRDKRHSKRNCIRDTRHDKENYDQDTRHLRDDRHTIYNKEKDDRGTRRNKERDNRGTRRRCSKEKDDRDTKRSNEKDDKDTRRSKEKDDKDTRRSKEKDDKDTRRSKEKDDRSTRCRTENDDRRSRRSREKDDRGTRRGNEKDDRSRRCSKENDDRIRRSKDKDDRITRHSKEKDDSDTRRSKEKDDSDTRRSKEKDDSDTRRSKEKDDRDTRRSKEKDDRDTKHSKESPTVICETELPIPLREDASSKSGKSADCKDVLHDFVGSSQTPCESTLGNRQTSHESPGVGRQPVHESLVVGRQPPHDSCVDDRKLPGEELNPMEKTGHCLKMWTPQNSEDMSENTGNIADPCQSEEDADSYCSSDSDSGSESSNSLTDPEVEGSIRTRGFLYYRDPLKPRPELEISFEEEEDEEEEKLTNNAENEERGETDDEEDSSSVDESEEDEESEDEEDDDDDGGQSKPDNANSDQDDDAGDTEGRGNNDRQPGEQEQGHKEADGFSGQDKGGQSMDNSSTSQPPEGGYSMDLSTGDIIHPVQKTCSCEHLGHSEQPLENARSPCKCGERLSKERMEKERLDQSTEKRGHLSSKGSNDKRSDHQEGKPCPWEKVQTTVDAVTDIDKFCTLESFYFSNGCLTELAVLGESSRQSDAVESQVAQPSTHEMLNKGSVKQSDRIAASDSHEAHDIDCSKHHCKNQNMEVDKELSSSQLTVKSEHENNSDSTRGYRPDTPTYLSVGQEVLSECLSLHAVDGGESFLLRDLGLHAEDEEKGGVEPGDSKGVCKQESRVSKEWQTPHQQTECSRKEGPSQPHRSRCDGSSKQNQWSPTRSQHSRERSGTSDSKRCDSSPHCLSPDRKPCRNSPPCLSSGRKQCYKYPHCLSSDRKRRDSSPHSVSSDRKRRISPHCLSSDRNRHDSSPHSLSCDRKRHNSPHVLSSYRKRHVSSPYCFSSYRKRHDNSPHCLSSDRKRHDNSWHFLSSGRKRHDNSPHVLSSDWKQHDSSPCGLSSDRKRCDSSLHDLSDRKRHDGSPHGLSSDRKRYDNCPHGLSFYRKQYDNSPHVFSSDRKRHDREQYKTSSCQFSSDRNHCSNSVSLSSPCQCCIRWRKEVACM